MPQIRTRFAPSPTGYVHLGNIRTALFAWAFARHHKGKFILRIEDTDVERSTPRAVQVVLDVMNWLGLDYDEGPFYQMKRMALYKKKIKLLVDQGLAYPCYMSMAELDALRKDQEAKKEKPRYNRLWRPEEGKQLPPVPTGVSPVLRFRNPERGFVEFRDLIKGRVNVANREMDDFVIARPDGTPTYNFCVVVDDIDMKITHVIRGDDHLNNTPRQINLYHALGAELPLFAHTPTVLTKEGKKLSKREGAKSVLEYKNEGYLPAAMVNMLGRLGWSHGDTEIFTPDQFVQWFDIDQVSAAASRFDPAKLLYLNRMHIRSTAPEKLVTSMQLAGLSCCLNRDVGAGSPQIVSAVELLQTRCDTLVELDSALSYFLDRPSGNHAETILPAVRDALSNFSVELRGISWEAEKLQTKCREAAAGAKLPISDFMHPLRLLLTGQTKTPPLHEVMHVLGRHETLKRISV